jgi:hypothetical protein
MGAGCHRVGLVPGPDLEVPGHTAHRGGDRALPARSPAQPASGGLRGSLPQAPRPSAPLVSAPTRSGSTHHTCSRTAITPAGTGRTGVRIGHSSPSRAISCSVAGLGLSVQVAVDGRSGVAELCGDLRDGVTAFAALPFSSYITRARETWRGPSLGFCPPVRPRARAAARPSRVRSLIKACSNSAMDPRIWKKHPSHRGGGVDAWSRTTRSTPRSCSCATGR